MNGSDMERDLARLLHVQGWQVLRAPSSGSVDRPAPDFLAARDGVVLAGELKAGDPPSNVDGSEVSNLQTFADAFGATAVLAGRWKGSRTFYFASPSDCAWTDGGNVSIPGSPSRWPWGAAVQYRIDTDTDSGPQYVIDSVETRLQAGQTPQPVHPGIKSAVQQRRGPLVRWTAAIGVRDDLLRTPTSGGDP